MLQLIFTSNYLSVESSYKAASIQLGSISLATPKVFAFLAMFVFVCLVNYFLKRTDLGRSMRATSENTMEAQSLGINVQRLTLVNMLLACLACSVIVSNVGLINFIGLVAPHIVRLVVGNNHVYLIPGSILAGATLLLLPPPNMMTRMMRMRTIIGRERRRRRAMMTTRTRTAKEERAPKQQSSGASSATSRRAGSCRARTQSCARRRGAARAAW